MDNIKQNNLTARVVGLMSGTSVDSIDVAVVEFSDPEPGITTLKLLGYQEQPLNLELRRKIFDACAGRLGVAELCELNFWVGEAFGRAVVDALTGLDIKLDTLDLVASHGQTIYHQMEVGRRRSTWQTGEAAVIAAQTGLTVASNFRVADVAAGGQGAPVVSYFDYLFFQNSQPARALLNIGGIANITYLPANDDASLIYAFDTGPGNMLIDYAARYYSQGTLGFDRDGAMARAGQVNAQLLAELLAHPYLNQKPPKTAGRENFGDAFAGQLIAECEKRNLSGADVIATLTAFTSQSVAQAHHDFGPTAGVKELVVSGGGARNPALMAELSDAMSGVRLRWHDEFGLAAECKEAVAFALFGYELLRGRPANLPNCTGASQPVLLGQLTPGPNFSGLLKKFAPFMADTDRPRLTNQKSENNGVERWGPKRKLILKK